jgi:hypothetical protein
MLLLAADPKSKRAQDTSDPQGYKATQGMGGGNEALWGAGPLEIRQGRRPLMVGACE